MLTDYYVFEMHAKVDRMLLITDKRIKKLEKQLTHYKRGYDSFHEQMVVAVDRVWKLEKCVEKLKKENKRLHGVISKIYKK